MCDLFSGQMITVSAETGIENKMTCLETRKGGVSSLQSWQASSKEKGESEEAAKWSTEEMKTEIEKNNESVL